MALKISGTTVINNSRNITSIKNANISDNQSTGIAITSYANISTQHSYLNLYGSRGTSSSPSIVEYQDVIGSVNAYSYNGSSFDKIGFIDFRCGGVPPSTPTSGNVPGSFFVGVRKDNNTIIDRIKIDLYGAQTYYGDDSVIFSRTARGPGVTYATFVGQHSASAISGGATNSCLIYSNGNIYNTNNVYSVISDSSLKENIKPVNSQWNDIKNLRVVNFNFKKETGQETHKQIGLIAQEVEKVSPGLVDVLDNFYDSPVKSVKTSVLNMKILKALQEAMERIEKLEEKLNDANIPSG